MWKNGVRHWIRKNDELHDGIVNNKKRHNRALCMVSAQQRTEPSAKPNTCIVNKLNIYRTNSKPIT